jgi:hypothetical protein
MRQDPFSIEVTIPLQIYRALDLHILVIAPILARYEPDQRCVAVDSAAGARSGRVYVVLVFPAGSFFLRARPSPASF